MSSVYRGRPKPRWPKKSAEEKPVDEVIREMRQNSSPAGDYRERSLKIHGLICAKCGREFDHKNRHLLTVHHKDGNHRNNPSDGSNWENLCVYCHDDEHSRGLLGDYLSSIQKKD
jgi:5-methylcytosine-specific restriction endonuclease McrA